MCPDTSVTHVPGSDPHEFALWDMARPPPGHWRCLTHGVLYRLLLETKSRPMVITTKRMVLAVAGIAGVLIYLSRLVHCAGDQVPASSGSDAGSSRVEVEDGIESLLVAAATSLAREREAQEVLSATLAMQGTRPSGGLLGTGEAERWSRTPRSEIDLAVAILTGSYDERLFARHVLLNPADLPLGTERHQDLAGLVDRLLSNSRDVRRRFRQMALAERRAAIEGGESVSELPVRPVDADGAARRVAKYHEDRGDPISLEEARAKIERGEAFSVRMPPNTSFIDGKLHHDSAFSRLPSCDAAFESLRQIALEEASLIVGWFAMHGYTDFGPGVMGIFQRMETISRLELDRLSR